MKKTLILFLAFTVGVALAMAVFHLVSINKKPKEAPKTKADLAIQDSVSATAEGQPRSQVVVPKTKSELFAETMVPGNSVGPAKG